MSLRTTEAVSDAARGALQAVDGWLQTLGGVFESFKMVGHLSCHVAWRIRDVLHRGLLSGSCILRQICEGLCIGLSLALYFVNTVVNIVLISTQNCASVLVGVWEAVAEPVHRVLELALTLLTFLYSCLVGASVLLWTPCQLLLDFLGALGRVFCTVAAVDSHGLLITAAVASLAFLLLNLRLPVLTRWLSLRLVNTLPGARGLQAVLEQERALPNQEVRTRTGQEASTARLPHTDAVTAETDLPSADGASRPDSLQLQAQRDGESASNYRAASRSKSGRTDGGSPPTDAKLLSLLKCVICQDLSKTVLLLPCRHLCLCRKCADILSRRRHVQQRCCPLCRQPITQTMDVFL
uniref:insulin isoform X2 n=1 Tax=Scatophagus argus TaxID=75038 RepID=UPI001ED80806|nr:insulin isoform X2 [Scatophagus argus]